MRDVARRADPRLTWLTLLCARCAGVESAMYHCLMFQRCCSLSWTDELTSTGAKSVMNGWTDVDGGKVCHAGMKWRRRGKRLSRNWWIKIRPIKILRRNGITSHTISSCHYCWRYMCQCTEGVAVRRVATPSMHWHILMHYSMFLPDLDADWLMLTHTCYCGWQCVEFQCCHLENANVLM